MATVADIEPPGADELLAVVGPTAGGKTELALQLAERLGGEIIGADSVQLYRHFDLGSGKPSAAERARAPHHLIDEIEPLDSFDAARFVARADQAIRDIRARGRVPIVCGGTFLWIKALLLGLAPSAPADPEIRREHEERAERAGRAALHAELARIDPECAAKLAPNDFVRVSRALEVFALTGKTQTEWHREHEFRTVRHRARLLGVARRREVIDERIRRRGAAWLAQGWQQEVATLVERGYRRARAMGSVGYRQVLQQHDGELPAAELLDAIVRATRTFVRKQRTWLRDQPIEWLDPPGS